jgi:hypothetical protein
MAYAHQGIELKNPYGVHDKPPQVSTVAQREADRLAPQRPASLSRKSLEVLLQIESDLRAARERKRSAGLGTGKLAQSMD